MNPISILVVDDATDTLEVIAQCLRNCGHHVTCVSGGLQAISILQDRYFDLVVTDLLMPDADGMQVIMAVRQYQPNAHVIAMSGGGDFFSGRNLLRLAGTLGAVEQLQKPFSRETLLSAIQRVCAPETLAGAA